MASGHFGDYKFVPPDVYETHTTREVGSRLEGFSKVSQNTAISSEFVVTNNTLEILECSFLKPYVNTLSRSSQWRHTRMRTRISA